MVHTTSSVESGKVPGGESFKNANQGVGAFSSRESREGLLRKKGLRGSNNNNNLDKEDIQDYIRHSHKKNQSQRFVQHQPKTNHVGAVPSSNQDDDNAVAKKGLRQNPSAKKNSETTSKESAIGRLKLPPLVQPEIMMRNYMPVAPKRGLGVANEHRRRKQEEEATVLTPSFAAVSPIVKGGLRRKDNGEKAVPSSSPNTVGNHLVTPTICAEEEIEIFAVKEEIEISPGTPILDNSKLVEAMPVAEEDAPADAKDLEEAQLVDLNAIKDAKAERDSRFKRYIGLLTFSIAVLAGAILTGTMVALRKSGPKIVTEAPSLVPSMAPTTTTSFPSEKPTAVVGFLELLPDSTRKRISNFSSPQYEAWHWLASHPNASTMEDWRKIQLFAMATFYFAFQGDSWDLDDQELISTWLNTSISECDWLIVELHPAGNSDYSIKLPPPAEEDSQSAEFQRPKELYDDNFGLCNEKRNVTILRLDHLNFAGLEPRIPGEISLLSSLSHIFLFGKYINTTVSDLIPSELGLLTNLTQIRLDYNNLQSTIPTHVGLLTSLEVLDLGDNVITGRLPTQIGLMSGLSTADFYLNRLTGKLPSQIGLLSELWRLSIRDNKLEGGIPTEVGQLSSLEHLWIYSNSFNYIPSQLGLVSTLRRVYAGYNIIAGIPSELGLLSNLEVLHLHKNYITGTMPTEVGALSPQKLERLSLGGNLLSGTIPTEMSKLASLESLYLYNNQLSGSLPSELGLFQNLDFLLLNHNLLTGSLPTEMDSALFLSLHHNLFSGSLPSEVGLLQDGYLLLNNNLLSGSLPTEIGQFSFRWLHLQNNQMSGKVPGLSISLRYDSWLWYPSELNLANNDLSGTVPNGVLDSLSLLDVRNTSLTGIMPDEYCSIRYLEFDCSAFLCGCSCSCDSA